MNEERIGEIGYINENMEHVLFNIFNPTITNYPHNKDLFQIAITLGNAKILLDKLNEFLSKHNISLH